MSQHSSEQQIKQSSKSGIIDKISSRSKHSQLQQQLMESISKRSMRNAIERSSRQSEKQADQSQASIKQLSSRNSVIQNIVERSNHTSKYSVVKDEKNKSYSQSQMSLAEYPVK